MNTDEKAKAYDEVLERAKECHIDGLSLHQPVKDVLEYIFPELAESENEKIRKEIISALKFANVKGVYDKHIAWLEKQGSEPNWCHHKVDLSDCPEEYRKVYYDGWNNCNMQHEQCNAEHKLEPKFKVGDWVVWDNKISRHIYNIYQGKESLMYIITDVHNMARSYSVKGFDNNAHLWSIEDAKDGDVLFAENFDNIGGCVFLFKGLDSWRFDAEGDRAIATGYCCTSITESGSTDFGIQGPDCVEIKRVHPATKEQRDALMEAMADAGYMWDSEKKEVMKIEQKSTDTNFSDLTTWKYIVDAVLTKEHGVGNYLDNPNTEKFAKELQERFGSVEQKPTECIKFSNGFENQVSNLLVSVLNGEHEYNEGFVKYVAQSLLGCAKNELKPTAWSEEDEKMFNSALWHIKNSCSNGGKNSGEFEVYNWVKSVKQRIGGLRYESKGNR